MRTCFVNDICLFQKLVRCFLSPALWRFLRNSSSWQVTFFGRSLISIALLFGCSYITWVGLRTEQLHRLHIYGVVNQMQERSEGYGCGCTLELLKRPWRVSSFCVNVRCPIFPALATCQSLTKRIRNQLSHN